MNVNSMDLFFDSIVSNTYNLFLGITELNDQKSNKNTLAKHCWQHTYCATYCMNFTFPLSHNCHRGHISVVRTLSLSLTFVTLLIWRQTSHYSWILIPLAFVAQSNVYFHESHLLLKLDRYF